MTLPLPDHAHRCAGRTDLTATGQACPLRPTCLRYTTLLDHHNTLPDHVRMHIPIATHYCTTPEHEGYIAADTDAEAAA